MSVVEEIWDGLPQTERLTILCNIYLASGPVDPVECSRVPYDELPDQVQNDLTYLTWKL